MKPIGIAALLAGVAISTAAAAQGIDAGRQVVERYCTQCHAIQGAAPPTSILPGVDRFVGITGGLAILLIVSLLLWPRESEVGEDKASAAD